MRQTKLLGLLIAFVTGVALLSAGHAEESKIQEYRVKAAFMYNFAKFVDWPDRTFANARDPMNICVFGDDTFSDVLERASSGKTAHGRRLAIKRIRIAEQIDSCQILFIAPMKQNRVSKILNSLQGSAVLTVGEMERFTESGGIINLFMEEGKYSFEVNLKAANNAGLRISSKLLKLAKNVRK